MSPHTPSGKSSTNTTPSNSALPRPKKRSRRDTIGQADVPATDITVVDVVSSREGSLALNDIAMDTPAPSIPETDSLAVQFGTVPTETMFINPDVISQMAQLLQEQIEGGHNMLDYIVTMRVLATKDDELPLQTQLTAKFAGEKEPERAKYLRHGDEVAGDLFWRPGVSKSGHLLLAKTMTFRVIKQRSFLWASAIALVWPPPLVMHRDQTANLIWSFELKDPRSETEALQTIGETLSEFSFGYFFAMVRAPVDNLCHPSNDRGYSWT
jgi:hypothetical protein